jgi:hypothetical protein
LLLGQSFFRAANLHSVPHHPKPLEPGVILIS